MKIVHSVHTYLCYYCSFIQLLMALGQCAGIQACVNLLKTWSMPGEVSTSQIQTLSLRIVSNLRYVLFSLSLHIYSIIAYCMHVLNAFKSTDAFCVYTSLWNVMFACASKRVVEGDKGKMRATLRKWFSWSMYCMLTRS